MLNELYRLSRNLQKCGIEFGKPHQNVKEPGKFEGFIIGIDPDGVPKTAEHISAEYMHGLWTLRKGQHNSFPYMKLKKPIFDIKFDDPIYEKFKNRKTELQEKTAILVQAAESYQLNKGQDLSLAAWTKSQMDEIEGKDPTVAALNELVKRVPIDKESSESFLKDLSAVLIKNLNEQTIDLIKLILVGDRKEKKIVCDASLFFDVSDWEKFQVRVAHPEMGLLVSKYLPKVESCSGISAFGDSEIQTESYPEPNLTIWKAYLFSMNEDALCHNRYGQIGSAIFPASPDEVQSMHGAIKWCVSGDRKGKTWQRVPDVNGNQDLLISYLEEKPENAIELASIFAAPEVKESDIAEAAYENKTKTACDALRGVPGLNDNSQVNVLVISKVDEGRAQVVLSSAFSIKNIIQSVEEWRIAAKNRPAFSLWLPPAKKGEKALQVEPSCPSPTDVMKCFQNQWIKNGLDKRDMPGVALRYVYDLFLGERHISQETAQMLLRLTLQRLGPLFVGIAGAAHASDVKDFRTEARHTVLAGISLLAIILYKLEIKKEDYMKNAAFNVGRLLAFADGLHAQYCKLQMKRKGDLPPQLIGNAYLPVALDNPNKAIALLGDRLRIYYAWATKVQGEEYKLVKWMLSEMGKVSAELENVSWPSMADDAAKAQVLLGYLARSKSEE